MSSTITGTVTSSVTLGNGTYSSPLTIAAGAEVSYGGTAAAVYSAYFATIVDLGVISGTAGDGIQLAHGGLVINSGTVSGAGTLGRGLGSGAGVYITGRAGTVINNGAISGTAYGVGLGHGGTVSNSGPLSGGEDGVIIEGGNGTITNYGKITATVDDGASLFDGGGIRNAAGATISGAGTAGAGVFITGASGTLANYGKIVDATDIGVLISDDGGVTNAASASISGLSTGLFIKGAPGTVTNAGSILATAATGAGVYLEDGGNITNASGGTISGGDFGAFLQGSFAIAANYGSISGGDALVLGLGGVVTNAASADISGATVGVYLKSGAASTLTNSGTIGASAAGGAGVELGDGGSILNNPDGSISGVGFGVFVTGTAGTVSNSGSITGSDGAALEDGGSVTNAAGAYIFGVSNGVYFGTNAPGTVVNSGSIGLTGVSGSAIDIAQGGSVTNTSSGVITGGDFGIFMTGTSGIVINGGGIMGSHAVALEAGGSITNASSGSITGGVAGVFIKGAAGNLLNYGSISAAAASGAAVDMESGGSVTNRSGASISGAEFGVYIAGGAGYVANAGTVAGTAANGFGGDLKGGGTVVDSGLIAGGAEAIYLGGSGSNLLELEAGYSLSGAVIGSGSATNTLELSGSLGAVSVTYNNLGLANFGFVRFGFSHGYDETLLIANTAALPGTIERFDEFHDIIDLRQLKDPSDAVFNFDSLTDQLTITEGAQAVTLQLAGDLAGVVWRAHTDGHGGTDVEPACYLAGTRILTREGEVAVEDLVIGDRIMTLSGEAKRIKWIGRRAYDPRFVAGNSGILPIVIKRGALGEDLPRHDLFVSPEHALFIDGMLVPARALANGVSIATKRPKGMIEYYHIELAEHDVIYAEGVTAETYVDCGNRGMFQNAPEFRRLYPGQDGAKWAYCAPVVTSGPELEEVRRRIAERAGAAAAVLADALAETDLWRSGAPAPAAPAPAGSIAPKIVKLAAA
jgi:hypothetical protein